MEGSSVRQKGGQKPRPNQTTTRNWLLHRLRHSTVKVQKRVSENPETDQDYIYLFDPDRTASYVLTPRLFVNVGFDKTQSS